MRIMELYRLARQSCNNTEMLSVYTLNRSSVLLAEYAKYAVKWHAKVSGAQGRNRTTDTRIFSPLLYQLSYLGVAGESGTRDGLARSGAASISYNDEPCPCRFGLASNIFSRGLDRCCLDVREVILVLRKIGFAPLAQRSQHRPQSNTGIG